MIETFKTELENYARINAYESRQRIENDEISYSDATLEFIEQLSVYWKAWNEEHFDVVYKLMCDDFFGEYQEFINLLDKTLEIFKGIIYNK